jgi:hypothetical protein
MFRGCEGSTAAQEARTNAAPSAGAGWVQGSTLAFTPGGLGGASCPSSTTPAKGCHRFACALSRS